MPKIVATSGMRSAACAKFLARRLAARRVLGIGIWGGLTALVVWSAILAKTTQHGPAPVLAELQLETIGSSFPAPQVVSEPSPTLIAVSAPAISTPESDQAGQMGPFLPDDFERSASVTSAPETARETLDPNTRWFDGRPVRVAREVWMTVTAYSPDARSCGPDADGHTATLHHVTTNGSRLVAADPRVLPYGSMITVPGYDQGAIVPVLDCGGAIKGHRLDVLYATHEQAREWGVKRLKVQVWEFADGSPRVNPRRER